MLRSLVSRLDGEAQFWFVTLLVIAVDDAAMLAMMFS
jgi:hypothetical protein